MVTDGLNTLKKIQSFTKDIFIIFSSQDELMNVKFADLFYESRYGLPPEKPNLIRKKSYSQFRIASVSNSSHDQGYESFEAFSRRKAAQRNNNEETPIISRSKSDNQLKRKSPKIKSAMEKYKSELHIYKQKKCLHVGKLYGPHGSLFMQNEIVSEKYSRYLYKLGFISKPYMQVNHVKISASRKSISDFISDDEDEDDEDDEDDNYDFEFQSDLKSMSRNNSNSEEKEENFLTKRIKGTWLTRARITLIEEIIY